MKLEAFSPESVGNAFLDLHERMTTGDFLAALLVSLVSAAAASLLYRFFYERRGTGSQIHRAFPLLALAVTTLFIGVQVSLPLSLGLLGSLSIIRFRTPIKEPEEVGFIMLVIAAAICAATSNFDFILYLYLFAVLALERAAEIERALAAHLPRFTLESASTRNGMSTNQYVFGGLRDPAALQKALFEAAPFAAVNVFLDRPGGIR